MIKFPYSIDRKMNNGSKEFFSITIIVSFFLNITFPFTFYSSKEITSKAKMSTHGLIKNPENGKPQLKL